MGIIFYILRSIGGLIYLKNKLSLLKSLFTQYPFLTLIIVASLYYFPFIGSFDLFEWDEIYYSSRVMDIYLNGNWIDQSVNAIGGLWTGSHPPLTLWFMVISVNIFGFNEFALRFPIACFGILTVLLVYKLTFKFSGNSRTSFVASLIYISIAYITKYTRMAQLDIPVIFWITISLYFYIESNFRKNKYLIFSGICFGLALLSKIIIGLIVPSVLIIYIFAISFYFHKRKYISLQLTNIAILFLIGCIVAFPWYLAETRRLGMDYWNEAIGYHVFSRMRNPLEGHNSPLGFLYYLLQIVNRFPVYIFFLTCGISEVWKKRRTDINSILLILLLAVPLLIFSFSATKYHTYILMFSIPIVILISLGIDNFLANISYQSVNKLIVISLICLFWSMTLPYQYLIDDVVRRIRNFQFPDLSNILISISLPLAAFLLYYFISILLNKFKLEIIKTSRVTAIIFVVIPAFIFSFGEFVPKNNSWITIRKELEKYGIDQLCFVGSSNSVNKYYLDLLKLKNIKVNTYNLYGNADSVKVFTNACNDKYVLIEKPITIYFDKKVLYTNSKFELLK